MAIAMACSADMDVDQSQRFALMPVAELGIGFSNDLPYTDSLNPYTYKSFYNGGGVGIGDLDNDGLQDLILTGNLVDNGVYRNRGDWTFEDIAERSGLAGANAWTSGVTLADVDGDGWLDVYLCKSGPPGGKNRRNELRINQRDGTFLDVAPQAGVDDYGLSVHAAFVDYDRDGDLDLYLLNNSIRSVGSYDLRPGQRDRRDSLGGNKLYRNDLVERGELSFTDVSELAGIYGSDIGFGLGVTVGDVNGDLWPDLYVSNDFFERDYLYINRGDGRFAERLTDLVPEVSLGAMGADMADLNGDGLPEVFVTEMLPADARRYRSKAQFESRDKRERAEAQGYHRQYSRNTLLLNREGAFSDVARLAGVEATDWSWGALIADLDNDGARDLYVANGIYKDLLDQDYIHFVANDENIREWVAEGGEVIKRLIDSMPSEAIANRAFRNLGFDVPAFADSTERWGLDQPSFSNGSAYGDLDNDGDLDLVANVMNGAPLVYRNQTSEQDSSAHFVSIRLRDTISRANLVGWGSRVSVFTPQERHVAEVTPVRGFMSTVDARSHFGLGSTTRIDSVVVDWSSGGRSVVLAPPMNVELEVTRSSADDPAPAATESVSAWTPLPWRHAERPFDDFDRYPLLPQMHSAEGPALATLQEPGHPRYAFFGGGRRQAPALFRLRDREWKTVDLSPSESAQSAEDVVAAWVDLDSDGDYDLVVGSGGDETRPEQFAVRLRLYRNLGGDRFTEEARLLPIVDGLVPGALAVGDFDADGDADLFFGTHFRLGRYGEVAPSALLINDGGELRAEMIDSLDLVRAAVAADLDADGTPELVLAREYGPVAAYRVTSSASLTELATGPTGMWQSLIEVASGEFLVGNLGLNSRLRSSSASALALHVGDFDANGSLEVVPVADVGGEATVAVQLKDLVATMPALRKRFGRFATYAEASVDEVLPADRRTRLLEAAELRSGSLRYDGTDEFIFSPLPRGLQTAPVRAFTILSDGRVFAAGNYGYVKPEFGDHLGSYGHTLARQADGSWMLAPEQLPLLTGEVRGLGYLPPFVIAARNDAAPLLYELSYEPDQH